MIRENLVREKHVALFQTPKTFTRFGVPVTPAVEDIEMM
jgi:hypothetical protein